ncbi:PREDICTED: uncharacterized protein LOC18605456 [Theobroma cacao]|uniref:Uncharacterized protein LOC18605456 n=1 Tax=Theobroma cacao TaxID=3641 RepID=A0AB32VDM6_THECC|nr:PREDICTED: uncharacterized protein LOC18605456 [Theobroma cacao]
MSSQTASPSNPTIVDDPYKRLEIILNSDGSLTRNPDRYPNTSATPDPKQPIPVLSKDITINQSNNIWARIFLPRQALHTSSKLPLIVYYHAGGFIHCSAASTIFHVFCSNMALELQAIIVSVDYRLAPENRLPAAYDDAMEALHWVKTTPEDWLKRCADLANCFLMGSSSGANIAYRAGLRSAEEADDREALKIRGLILHQPFFGGSEKVESELRLVNDPILPPGVSDLMWELALPIGADRDHAYCNPAAGKTSKVLDKLVSVGWMVLVTGCDGDPLIDRQVGLVKLMEEKGMKVVSEFRAGDHHGVDFMQPAKARALFLVLKEFILSASATVPGDGETLRPPITDPFEYLQIVLNPDGTLTRNLMIPRVVAEPNDPEGQAPVLSKDVPINPSNRTWARIFLPRQALDCTSSSANKLKLPLVVYYHGGGFVLLSADMGICHDFCSNMSKAIPAIVVSVDYRLAPENRLPAAYDDGLEALHWIKTTGDEWLREYADLSNCFLMGSSAGGNIAYHVGLRAAEVVHELEPLKIKGLVLHQPFFGGTQRIASELRLMNDPVLPPIVSDVMWDLSLPIGVDRDHEYCNPTADGGSKELEKIKSLGWKVLVYGSYGDPLIDRQIELLKLVEGKGVQVVRNVRVGGFHGEEEMDVSKAHAMHMVVKDFIMSSKQVA